MPFDLRKTLTDAGYVTIGVGVLGYQQAQVRRRELQSRLGGALGNTGGCLNGRATDGKTRLDTLQKTVAEKTKTVAEKTQGLRDTIETQARTANDWAQELGIQLKERVEPVVGQVVDQVGERIKTLPNRAA